MIRVTFEPASREQLERIGKEVVRKATGADSSGRVPIRDLMNAGFVRRHTRFASFDAMCRAAPGAKVAIGGTAWESQVRATTTWNAQPNNAPPPW